MHELDEIYADDEGNVIALVIHGAGKWGWPTGNSMESTLHFYEHQIATANANNPKWREVVEEYFNNNPEKVQEWKDSVTSWIISQQNQGLNLQSSESQNSLTTQD